MPDFPTGLPDIPNASPAETLFTMHAGSSHVTATNRILANVAALAAKLGIGAGGPPASGAVLRRTATGVSGWGQATAAEIAANAIGTAQIADSQVTSSKIADGTIVNGDINVAAAIAYAKLALANSIQAADLVPGAATYGSATGSFTGTRTASGFADVDSTNGKLTFTAPVACQVLAFFSGVSSNSLAAVAQQVALKFDSGGDGPILGVYSYPGAATYPVPFAIAQFYLGVAPGVHTITARHSNNSASGTMTTTGVISAVELRR